MKNKLPNFASSLAWLVVLAAVSLVLLKVYQPHRGLRIPLLLSGPAAAADQPGDATSPADPATADQPSAGQPLVADAARRLESYSAIEARIRQRVDLFGQQISGVGRYQQWGKGQPKRLRLELKFQVADQLASLQQVSDGRFFWERRDMPENSGQSRIDLHRIDLRRIQEAIDESETRPPDAAMQQWMPMGGLARLLSALDRYFDFSVAEPRVLQEVPVWRLVGHWKAEALDQLVPEQAAHRGPRQTIPTDRLPPHLPDTVVLVLGRDERLPLFPYRIEYRRQVAAPRTSPPPATPREAPGRVASVEITTIELFEVNPSPSFRAEDFSYDPGEQVVHDGTEQLLRKLWGEGPAK